MKKAAMVIFIIALCGSTVLGFWLTSLHTATVNPYMDSYSWQSVPNANNGGSDNFEITSYDKPPNNMRGWMALNLSKLPQDIILVSVKLRLRIWHKTTNDPAGGIGDPTGRIYGVYRLLGPWTEFNVTWTNQPNYTEEHYSTAAVPAGQGSWNGTALYMEWDVTEIVRDWMSGTPNYGVLVRDTRENATTLYSTQFFQDSNKDPNESYYPQLIVTYTTATPLMVLAAIFAGEALFIIAFWRRKSSSAPPGLK